jgi:hypothetical protein
MVTAERSNGVRNPTWMTMKRAVFRISGMIGYRGNVQIIILHYRSRIRSRCNPDAPKEAGYPHRRINSTCPSHAGESAVFKAISGTIRTCNGPKVLAGGRINGGVRGYPVIVSLPAHHLRTCVLVFLISCILVTGTASATGIQAYLGDTIPLSGYSPTSPYVYLFLTGPNLPVNGVALNNINNLAEDGGFTKVAVDGGNDMWSYKWGTSSLGGRLDEGTYTIWVVNGPNDRAHLSNAEYATISVTLSSPTISLNSAATQAVPPSLQVSSEPSNASVSVDGQYLGKTPFTTDKIETGTHTVTVSKFGYSPYTTNASLVNGMTTVITATLPAQNGALAVTTDPAGAGISIDGKTAVISPARISDLAPGNHTVTITKDGYNSLEQQVSIEAGLTRQLAVSLSPASPLTGVLPLKTPWPTAGMLLGICAAVVAVAVSQRGAH